MYTTAISFARLKVGYKGRIHFFKDGKYTISFTLGQTIFPTPELAKAHARGKLGYYKKIFEKIIQNKTLTCPRETII